ncbi:MAG: hypothetical protein JRG81_09650 [Deltaproteobacteria bacterium]|nr:hypothetical protein [Deltaproteobacteria bacterium]
MAFVQINGLKGKVYVPDERPDSKKQHPCKDCYACQQCSDTRCALCRDQQTCMTKNPSNK